MLEIQARQYRGIDSDSVTDDIFKEQFLLKRPLLQAVDQSHHKAPVLLIDELDRADEEFESFLLELLSDFQIAIPEIGTLQAEHKPVVIITSNRAREIHDALKRRCVYYWIDYPSRDKEVEIVRLEATEPKPQTRQKQFSIVAYMAAKAGPADEEVEVFRGIGIKARLQRLGNSRQRRAH